MTNKTHSEQAQVLTVAHAKSFHFKALLQRPIPEEHRSLQAWLVHQAELEARLINPFLAGHPPHQETVVILPDSYRVTIKWVFGAAADVTLEAL